MESKFLRLLRSMDVEERILNGAAIVALLAVFFPWISGEWLGGDNVSYSGFGFYTSFLGVIIFLLLLIIVASSLLPLLGGPILFKRRNKEIIRLVLAAQATILVLASLSVLTKITYEFTRMEIRFGIYLALVSCLVTTIYCFLKWQEQRRQAVHDLFHHPEDTRPSSEPPESQLPVPPPPPPPPPLEPEEHHNVRP